MMHGPCGLSNPNSPCMVDGKCSKQFPKDFVEKTFAAADGYPHYRRRNDGKFVEKKWHLIRQQICCSLQSIPEKEI